MQAILALLLVSADAAAPPPSPPPPARTMQQEFDAASDNALAGKCDKAVPAFEALERAGKIRPGTIVAAAVGVRKGQCLGRLGRSAEGEAAIEAGLPMLERAGESFSGDVALGHNALGDAAMDRWDYAGATFHYRTSLGLQKGDQRFAVLTKLARSTAFDGGPQPLAYAQEAIDLMAAQSKPNKDTMASLYTLHARILLNQGQAQAAYSEMKKALSLSGGLTSRTTLPEVSLRGDLATAAMQVGRKEDARLYLAYTGAGRISESPFASAVMMDPPLCGEETGLRPEDVAVVEFSIAEDGSVRSAHTVHSRGGPAVAAAFGKAVSEWAWSPDQIAKIPAFYRLVTRVEVRCSNVLGRGPGIFSPLRQRFADWVASYLPATMQSATSVADKSRILRDFAAESGRNGNSTAQFAALALLANTEIASVEKNIATSDEALSLAAKATVPAEAVNWARVTRFEAAARLRGHVSGRALKAALELLQDPALANDALAADTLRLSVASPAQGTSIKEAPDLLNAVANDSRLPEHHPLRQFAWLQLANRAVQAGDRAGAQAHFAKTGLTSQQCALLAAAPAMRSSGASSSDYPMEALMMGFEGWVRLEYDITADGKAAGTRPIIAYPPLVFVEAATGMSRGFRYETSFRPDNSVACSANQETIRFVIPSAH